MTRPLPGDDSIGSRRRPGEGRGRGPFPRRRIDQLDPQGRRQSRRCPPGRGVFGGDVPTGGATPIRSTPQGHVSVVVSQTPAFAGDAPDPDIVYSGGTYYAFTTGTQLGNHLQALVDTSGNPTAGWGSYTGHSFGSSALPATPSWETVNTQTSPGVFFYGGHWVMWYDASVNPHPVDSGHSCLSVATAASLTPSSPVFTDSTGGPTYCGAGGSAGDVLDPSPFVDPATGAAYLLWKSNDGTSAEPSQVWSVRLSADGTHFAGTPTVLLTVDQADLPWETTVDDPQMVFGVGGYDLLFSPGDFQSASYAEALTTCSGPLGPCGQPAGPFLTSYGSVAGPGGGSLFQDAAGSWWLGYAAWPSGCTGMGNTCGGVRRLFVAPIDLTNDLNVPCAPPAGAAGRLSADGQRRWDLHVRQPALLRIDRGHPHQPAGGRDRRHLRRRGVLDGRPGRRHLRLR